MNWGKRIMVTFFGSFKTWIHYDAPKNVYGISKNPKSLIMVLDRGDELP